MSKSMFVFLAASLAATGGIGWAQSEAVSEAAVNVRTAMVEGVNPAALAIWDVGNNAVDDDGVPDPALLGAEKVSGAREAAQILAIYADRLATAESIEAAGPDLVGGKVPEGVASKEQIQAAIDADPEGFRKLAAAMGEEARGITAAIEQDDMDDLAFRLATFDGACQSCHANYWYVHLDGYPDQASN